MKIVVCVKYVPDAQAERTFDATDNTTDRKGVDGLLSELDEYAVEEALKIAEGAADDAEVVVLTMGPQDAEQAIRKALQMGADSGVHVLDDALHGSDAPATSLVLAKAVEKIGGADLVLTGMASTDGSDERGARDAGRAARPPAGDVRVRGDAGRRHRDRSGATATRPPRRIEASLPALVSVTDQINEPRYPSFKGIMAAKKKPVETWSLADLGVDAGAGRPGRRVDQGVEPSRSGRRASRGRSSPTRGTAARSSPSSSPPASSSDALDASGGSHGRDPRAGRPRRRHRPQDHPRAVDDRPPAR